MTTSPISNIDLSESPSEDSTTNNSSDLQSMDELLRDLRRTPTQKAEPVKIPQKLDYYTVYYRSDGSSWMGGCCLHLNPRDAIVEMQGLKASYNQFQIVKINLPV